MLSLLLHFQLVEYIGSLAGTSDVQIIRFYEGSIKAEYTVTVAADLGTTLDDIHNAANNLRVAAPASGLGVSEVSAPTITKGNMKNKPLSLLYKKA